MKRVFKAIFIVALCVLLLSLVVSAHSGKTDANGGHYNQSTGEYHYHHGYSAHDHYDMDGDGIKDCPYDFDDKTNHNNSGYGSNKTSNTNINETLYNSKNESNSNPSPSLVYWWVAAMILVALVMFFIIRAKNQEIEEHEGEIRSLTEELRNSEESIKITEQRCVAPYVKEVGSLKSQVDSLHKQLKKSNSENVQLKQKLQNMEKAPAGITFAEDGMPIFWKKSDDKPYGDYTVFYSSKSKIYHVDRWCASYSAKKQHIFNVIEYGTPCKKCTDGFFDFTSVPEWFTNDQNRSE